MTKIVCSIISVFVPAAIFAQIFVAVDGSDANPGTFDRPFQTIAAAVASASQGDTIYVRGGTYEMTSTLSIAPSKSGSETERSCLFAYQDERPLLDFSKTEKGVKGINLKADYWHIKGLDIARAGDNGMEIDGGSNNRIEFCSFYENRDTGLQLSTGASNNQIINCDSYNNADPPEYKDADGFAPKLTVGNGNAFSGCRSWGNCDDGWDGYLRGADDVTTTLENCWTWKNGYLKDGTDPGSQANGNGFKMGGGDDSNIQRLMHHFILVRCLSFENKGKGFDQNNNTGSMTILNSAAYDNQVSNYRIEKAVNAGQAVTVKNCISLAGDVELVSSVVQERNSWYPLFVVGADDFLSVDPSSASAPRKADGSLPDIDFMHLASESDLIDAGVDLGLSFIGKAPDLGPFESAEISAAPEEHPIISGFVQCQNYPNPFNPSTTIEYTLFKFAPVTLKVYDLAGREVETVWDGLQQAGTHRVIWPLRPLPSGLYFLNLQTDGHSETRKLILQK